MIFKPHSRRSIFLFLLFVCAWLQPRLTPAQPITYVDASTKNLVLATSGIKFNYPTTAASGTDNLWRLRAFGNGGTIYEAAGDISETGRAVDGNKENCSRLALAINGLKSGVRYRVYAYFWVNTKNDWRLRAGLTNCIGDLPLFTQSEPTAVASDFVVVPLITEADRVMKQAYLGTSIASHSGAIIVYLDDDPSSRQNIADGAGFRSWLDGVGYSRADIP